MSEGQGKDKKDTDGQNKGCAAERTEHHAPLRAQNISFQPSASVVSRLRGPC